MGLALSQGLEEFNDPSTAPRVDRPYTFDPNYGFPTGRKPREMKASMKQMEHSYIDIGLRDYCAHLSIPYEACQAKWAPFASHKCHGLYHKWVVCQHQDFLIRTKEYERERRLLKRKQRKEMAANKQAKESE